MEFKKWKILKSEVLIKNKWLTVRKDHIKIPTGVEMDDYYVLEYPDWVAVIAITEDGKYIMERQYRHGIQRDCVELCGGRIEKGEKPISAAMRELKEETGYGGGMWKLFSVTASNSSAMNNYCYTFLALGVK